MLTRDEIFALDDITITEITVPTTIPVWGGKSLMIKQLSRGQQDAYNKRQFSEMLIKQDGTNKQQKNKTNRQEITGISSVYGHDAWLCVRGICDANGKLIFTDADIARLNEKSGEAIGWIAKEIVKFSGMADDVPVEEEIKN